MDRLIRLIEKKWKTNQQIFKYYLKIKKKTEPELKNNFKSNNLIDFIYFIFIFVYYILINLILISSSSVFILSINILPPPLLLFL